MKQCKGCGAPLEWSKGNACEYCGTPFHKPPEDFFLDMTSGMGVLKLGNEEFRVALYGVRVESVGDETYRDGQGMMCVNPIMKHEFKLVEV